MAGGSGNLFDGDEVQWGRKKKKTPPTPTDSPATEPKKTTSPQEDPGLKKPGSSTKKDDPLKPLW